MLAVAGWVTAMNLGVHLWMSNRTPPSQQPIVVHSPPIVAHFPAPASPVPSIGQEVVGIYTAPSPPFAGERGRGEWGNVTREPITPTISSAAGSEEEKTGSQFCEDRDKVIVANGEVAVDYMVDASDEAVETAEVTTSDTRGPKLIQAVVEQQSSPAPSANQTHPPATPSSGQSLPDAAPQAGQSPMTTEPPVSAPSSLLGQLGRAAERADQSAAPGATGVDAGTQSSAIDTTQLVRQSTSAASISGIRRSPVSIQPTVRGYQQQQIYGQYQGAQFVPVRFDFDSILSNVDPGLIDNLIIISGPYGLKYGPGLAFIDVVATATPRSECPEWHSRTNLLYQTSGDQLYGRETLSFAGPDYGMRFSYGHKVGSDYESGDGTNIPATYNVRDVDFAFGLDLTEYSKLEIEYLSQDLTDTEYAGLIFDAEFRRTEAVFLRYTCDDIVCNSKLLVEAWYNRTKFAGDNLNDSKQFFYRDNLYFNAQGASFFPDVAFVGFTKAESVSAGFRIAPTWGGEDELQLTAGVDFHYIQQRLDEFDDFTDNTLQFSPVGFDNFPVLPSESVDPGLFIEATAPVADDLELAAGARVDWLRTDAEARHRTRAPDGTRPLIFGLDELPRDSFEDVFGTGMTKHDVLMAMFASADYTINENIELRLGFGHGQRPPSLTERYAYLPFLTVIQDATNAPLGDPNLDPEKASQFDLALSGNYDCLRFRTAGFCSLVEDFISFDYIFFPTTPDVPTLVFANTRAILAGFEAGGEYDLAPCWTPFMNMSYVDGRDEDADRPLPSIAPFQARVGVRWHDPENQCYGVEFAARIVDNQDRIADDLFESATPGFTIYDLRAWWQVNECLRLTTGIDNLTNKNYLEHLSVHAPRVLEPGLNFYLAMQLDY